MQEPMARVFVTLPQSVKERLEREAADQQRSLSNYLGYYFKQKFREEDAVLRRERSEPTE